MWDNSAWLVEDGEGGKGGERGVWGHLEGFLEERTGSHQLHPTVITGSGNFLQGLGGN